MEKKAEKQEIRYAWRINVYFPGGKWVAGQKYYATRKECEDANREWLDKHPEYPYSIRRERVWW